jgi:hypothetical protein
MDSITQVTEALQVVLTTQADEIARATGFVQRASKLTGSKFVQTLVLTWLADPAATYEQLAQSATALEVPITAQGIEQRFTPQAAECLKRLLAAAMKQVIQATPVAVPVLGRFNGVYIQDGTTIALPPELAELWPGCGNGTEVPSAALKVQLQFNWSDGQCLHLDLQAGRASDRAAPMQTALLPAGALRLADLGYYSLPTWEAYTQQGGFWLSRLPPQCGVYDEHGAVLDLPSLLPRVVGPTYDQAVRVSQKEPLAARLVAVRVAPAVAAARRRKVRADAKRKGHTPSVRLLALCEWVLLVTNIPAAQLSAHDALVLARVRWQIELVFKLWKSHGQVDESRSAKTYRMLCEVYAKLLGLLIQHWILIVTGWAYANRSWFKAAKTIRQHVTTLLLALADAERMRQVLETIGACLAKGARLNTRKATPTTVQLLLACTDE